jgi:hypothetical protein
MEILTTLRKIWILEIHVIFGSKILMIIWSRQNTKQAEYIFPLVLCGWETWSVTLREDHKLHVWKQSTREIFGIRRDKVRGELMISSNEQLGDLQTYRPSSTGTAIGLGRIGEWCADGRDKKYCWILFWKHIFESCHLEDREGILILRWVLEKRLAKVRDRWNWFRIVSSSRQHPMAFEDD